MRKALLIVVTAAWTCSLAPAAENAPEAGKPKPEAKEEAIRTIKEALRKRISFDFVETPIGDVIAFIQTLINVNVVVDPDIDRKTAVTLKVNNMTVGNALQWILKLVGAQMEIKDNALYISAGAKDPATRARIKKLEGELDRYRKQRTSRMIGKAQVKLGGVATIELHLYDDQLPTDVRNLLYKLLHEALTAELEKVRKHVHLKRPMKVPMKVKDF